MNKADLINALAERNGITKKEADKAVSSVLEIIEEALKNGDKVQPTGLSLRHIRRCRRATQWRSPSSPYH